MSGTLSSNQWGTRERLDAWLNGCRLRGELGTSVRIDFELVKEGLTEIDRLREVLELIADRRGNYGVRDLRGFAREALGRASDETTVATTGGPACAHPVGSYVCPTCGIHVTSGE